MKPFKIVITMIAFIFFTMMSAQETDVSNEAKEDKISYYQKRALEDANYEQQFQKEYAQEEETYWEEQKNYEKNLKKKDKKAYKAYLKGKSDAYKAHYRHCNTHCYHSEHYYHNVTFYDSRYDPHYYERNPRSNGTSTRVSIGTPSVRLGLF